MVSLCLGLPGLINIEFSSANAFGYNTLVICHFKASRRFPCWFSRAASSARMGTEYFANVLIVIKPDPPPRCASSFWRTEPLFFMSALLDRQVDMPAPETTVMRMLGMRGTGNCKRHSSLRALSKRYLLHLGFCGQLGSQLLWGVSSPRNVHGLVVCLIWTLC